MNGNLNRPTPIEPADIPPASHPFPINNSKPTRTEIRNAIKRLKTGKAPDTDSIPPEAIKADIETLTEMLHERVEPIWEESVPEQWKDGHLIKLPMPGKMLIRII